jgi:hypothetical protein
MAAAVAKDERISPLFDRWSAQLAEEAITEDQLTEATARLDGAEAFLRDTLDVPAYAGLLAFALRDEFLRRYAAGRGWAFPERQGMVVRVPLPPMPAQTFGPRVAEPDEVRLAALERFYRDVRDRIVRARREAVAGGRAPRSDASNLTRWGRWLYDLEIREPRRSPYEVARELHQEKVTANPRGHRKFSPECGCYKAVRDGLAAARAYLGVEAQGGN